MKVNRADDIKLKLVEIIEKLEMNHINPDRIICMRSTGSTSDATARIWSFPKIWQKALDLESHYIIEVLAEKYDDLSEDDKQRTLIHELMHVPKTFSGALVPHKCFGKRIDRRSVEKLFKEFKRKR